jgi:hypothetical protein
MNKKSLSERDICTNASAHRGHQFKSNEVNQVMDIVENLLQAIYALEPAAEEIKTATPPRKKSTK